MNIYLTYGKSSEGDLFDIASQKSGKGGLVCPFCSVPLIAVKGRQKQHHFRHDGDTCNESLTEIPQIQGWDHFHLSVPKECVELLLSHYDSEAKNPKVYLGQSNGFLETQQLIKLNEWTGNYELTDRGLIIVGALPLPRFNIWMRETLKKRFADISGLVKQGAWHVGHRDIEAYRQQSILNSSLYLFQYEIPGRSTFYKLGRTSREPKVRLQETVADMKKSLGVNVNAKILRVVANSGYVEQFALYKYKTFKLDMGSHQEYLSLDDKTARNLKSELTRLSNTIEPFDKHERFIVSGRWTYEEKRLAQSKKGITQTLNSGGSFGRPKGTAMNDDEFLSKYPQVVNLLKNEKLSIGKTVERTGISRSTVKRIKARLS